MEEEEAAPFGWSCMRVRGSTTFSFDGVLFGT
jgi:hypothetical protein